MPMPTSKNARLFYRAAMERLDDASLLMKLNRTTAAVYLAGYSVECILKSLILSVVPRRQQDDVLAMFRGARAHDYRWLVRLYLQRGGTALPNSVFARLNRVNSWSTEMRYSPATIQTNEAQTFLNSVNEIIKWADRRL